MLEYAHLAIKLDLEKAIGEVKEACENIQRTTEHVQRKAEGMDIHPDGIFVNFCYYFPFDFRLISEYFLGRESLGKKH